MPRNFSLSIRHGKYNVNLDVRYPLAITHGVSRVREFHYRK
jgi:hypothetical protein